MLIYYGDEIMVNHLEIEFYRTLFNTSKYFMEKVTENVEGYGMTVDNFRILELLYTDEKTYTVQKISEKLHIPSGSITYVVNRLVKQGYVKKTPSPTDGRANLVVLTETGEEIIRNIIPEHVQFVSSKLGEISVEEINTFIELLRRVGAGFDNPK
jgi:MarR family 2-MHQ and catechol resistance regulon transcriptional repressor